MSMISFNIELTEQIDKDLELFIFQGLRMHALSTTGHDGDIKRFAVFAKSEDGYQGALIGRLFWGCLQIKLLYVIPEFRGKGLGTTLVDKAFEFSRERKCFFATVETLDFQALDFYKRLGFEIEFIRRGYNHDRIFYYLRQDIKGIKT